MKEYRCMPDDEQELPKTQPQINLIMEDFVRYLRRGEVERALNQMNKISKLLPAKADTEAFLLSIREGFTQSSLFKKDLVSQKVTISKEDKEMFQPLASFPELMTPDGATTEAKLDYKSFTFCMAFLQVLQDNGLEYAEGERQPFDRMTDTEKNQWRLVFESQSYLGSMFSSYRKIVDTPYT